MIFKNVDDDTVLYRYVTVSQFLSIIETRQIHLSNITKWEDTWEGALYKIPAQFNDGSIVVPTRSPIQDMYGQCWSYFADSDAMWRIYSPHREGMMIKTSAKKFRSLRLPSPAILGKVIYTDFSDIQSLQIQDPLEIGLIKREAFAHEHEVRLLVFSHPHNDDSFIRIHIDPIKFIDGIIVDPRASSWFVETVTNYCARVGLQPPPTQSSLYTFDTSHSLPYVMRFTPIEDE